MFSEFLFREGYFPIVRFSVGDSEPDTLLLPLGISLSDIRPLQLALSEETPFIVEAKQHIGRTVTARHIKKYIGQTVSYFQQLRGVCPRLGNDVYLVVFYDGDTRYVFSSQPYEQSGAQIHVVLIYVGNKKPSELKSCIEISLEEQSQKNSPRAVV